LRLLTESQKSNFQIKLRFLKKNIKFELYRKSQNLSTLSVAFLLPQVNASTCDWLGVSNDDIIKSKFWRKTFSRNPSLHGHFRTSCKIVALQKLFSGKLRFCSYFKACNKFHFNINLLFCHNIFKIKVI
jgi:hypothetical protein